ncbi:MAG TPA: hypothetical protein VFZ47_04195, partial [Chitinophagaceae bacterium]
ERGLQSFGMMAVELSSGSGQKLQIAGGKNATVSFPIPASLRGRAPATIPLWYFDEVKGLWREEGSATRQGDAYVGTVTHFSFWNCDAPFAVVDFEAVFKDQHGNPHVRAQVTIRRTSNDVLGYGMTDSSGRVKGKIPANEALVLNMMDRCYNLVHTQNIGPFANGVNLGTVTVNSTPSGPVTISGTVVNCSNNPVTNGYVNVYLDGTNRRTNINNGSFSITIPRCNNNPTQAQLLAVDVAASQQGTTVNVPVTTGAVNAGQISACGVNLTEFINYTIDGNSFSFTPPDSLTCFHYSQSFPATTTVMGLDLSGNRDMTFAFADAGNVANVITSLSIRHGNTEYKKSSTSGSMVVTNVQLGNPGDFVSGSFSGSVVNGTTTHTFTCSFRVRRVF